MVFCVDTGKQLQGLHSSAPGSSWESGSSTQGCANSQTDPRALLGLFFLTQKWHKHGEDSPCNTDSTERIRGKVEQQVYLQMGNVSNTTFLSQEQSQGFSTQKQQWKTIQEPLGPSRLSRLLLLLLLLLEGCVMGFPLLSQFVGLRRDPPRPSIRAGQGLQPLSPTEAPGACGGWTQCHREQGWDTESGCRSHGPEGAQGALPHHGAAWGHWEGPQHLHQGHG